MSSRVGSAAASSPAINSDVSGSISAPATVTGSSTSARLSFAFTSSVSGRKAAVSSFSSSRLLSNDDEAEAALSSSASPAVRVRDDSGASFSALSSLATPASAGPLVIPLKSSLSWRERQSQHRLEQDRLRVEAAAASAHSVSASASRPSLQPTASSLPSLAVSASDPQYAVAVSEFGSAMLRGMGWKGPGDAVGGVNKADVQPVILKQRGDRAGLGAERATDAAASALPPHLQPRTDERPQQPTAGTEGRKDESAAAQLRAKAGGRLLKLEAQQLKIGSLVEVVAGRWKRQYGRVEAVSSAAGDGGRRRCEVRLHAEERTVELGSDELEVLDERALPDEHSARRGNARNGSPSSGSTETADADSRGERQHVAKAAEAMEREASKRQKVEHRDTGGRPTDSAVKSSSSSPGLRRSSPSSSRPLSSSPSPPRCSSWCVPNLHVRLVSRSLSPASLYRSKAVVQSVLDASHIAVLLDDGGQRLDGLREEQLETVVGSRGSSVQVVRGRRRGRSGQVLSKDADRERVRVRLDGEQEALELHLDDVCELLT